ncbi:MAG: tRNA-intron lyase [Candidatus Bathyarchaeia archaeon]
MKYEAELVGSRLIVWDSRMGMELYKMGFYGKPVGMPKPKPDQEFDSPLMLDLMEGLYLFEKNIIKIIDSRTKKEINKAKILKLAEKTYKGFRKAYSVYKDLRGKGYVVTPGIKFGADFAVYEHGPGIDHAPFIISVKSKKESMGTFDIVRAGRLATTVRKQFIVAIPDLKTKNFKYLIFKWFKA